MLSEKANKIYEYIKNNYIIDGYMYGGCVIINELFEVINTNNHRDIMKIIVELQQENLIQERKCQGYAIELTVLEKKKLIEEKNLGEIWEKKAPYVYPNSIHGEIHKILG